MPKHGTVKLDEIDLDLALPCGVDPQVLEWAGRGTAALEMKLATNLVDNEDVLLFVACTLERKPGGPHNWIEAVGGHLPEYICRVARSIATKRGKTISNAIGIAIGAIKNWAHGHGDVDPDTRAKAVKALAEWTALKAKAKAAKAKRG